METTIVYWGCPLDKRMGRHLRNDAKEQWSMGASENCPYTIPNTNEDLIHP